MRLVHLADLHLGFRQYQRLTPGGINQREADVARTFTTAIDAVIGLAPDLILIAGDVFHTVRPTNPAILHAFNQLGRLRQALPGTEVVMVAGNHDTPRSSETGCILQLFSRLGIRVVDQAPQRLSFPAHDLSILAIPDVPGDRPALLPDPAFRHNVLLVHGAVPEVLPEGALVADRAAVEIPLGELRAERWSYVALGHYHVYREVRPNAFYAGSLDYTSVNPWGELQEQQLGGISGKGFIERNLVTGEHRFHSLAPSRPWIDLPPLQARGRPVGEIDALIRTAVEGCRGGIDDRIVRLRVFDVPRHVARELDHRAIREYKRRALHFHLDLRRPERVRTSIASGAPGRRPTLEDVVREHLAARLIDADVDRDQLVTTAVHYVREAELSANPAAPVSDP